MLRNRLAMHSCCCISCKNIRMLWPWANQYTLRNYLSSVILHVFYSASDFLCVCCVCVCVCVRVCVCLVCNWSDALRSEKMSCESALQRVQADPVLNIHLLCVHILYPSSCTEVSSITFYTTAACCIYKTSNHLLGVWIFNSTCILSFMHMIDE